MSGVSYRITAGKKGLLLTIAAIADGIQVMFKFFWFTGVLGILSEAVGWAMSGLAGILLAIGFMASHVQPMSTMGGKARILTALLFEASPLINAVPTFTVLTVLTIRQSRAEDEERAKLDATMATGEDRGRYTTIRRMRRESQRGVEPRRMRRVLRNIPHPAARAMSVALTAKGLKKEPGVPPKNAS